MIKPFRPQFTLRLMLFATALFGIALGVWRWPWVEEETYYEIRHLFPPNHHNRFVAATIATARVPYHRDWNGKRLKHGILEAYHDDGKVMLHQPWRDGLLHGVERWYDSQGVHIEQTWNNGERDGPFRYRNGKDWVCNGKFVDGVAYYVRRNSEVWGSNQAVWCITTWRDDKRHGPAKWETPEGKILQFGEYGGNLLVTWNGESVVNYLADWIASGKIDAPHVAEALQNPAVFLMAATTDVFAIQQLPEFGVPKDIYLELELGIFGADTPEELISNLLPFGLAPDWRYGQIWIVPTDEVGVWRDPTGVSELDVAQFPKLAELWNRPMERLIRKLDNERLDELFELWPGHTEVFLDYVRHSPEESKRIANDQKHSSVFDQDGGLKSVRLTLKNYLGLRLYLAGLQCELQGNKIVILPHWTKRREMSASATTECAEQPGPAPFVRNSRCACYFSRC